MKLEIKIVLTIKKKLYLVKKNFHTNLSIILNNQLKILYKSLQ
jgi:hypothetical protein